MKPMRPRKRKEKSIQDAIRARLEKEDWFVQKMHGNRYQAGVPDLYCHHLIYGARWIEVKRPSGRLTPAQVTKFNRMEEAGLPIWILSNEDQIGLLFDEPNWREWL